MTKILVAGAGGAPSEGVIRSLLRSPRHEEVIGMGSEPTDLALSAAQRKYYVPYALAEGYRARLLSILESEKPDLIHFQNDQEILVASGLRADITRAGTRVFMPAHEEIDTCVHKYKSYLKFKEAGLAVPRNLLIRDESDLRLAFAELGGRTGKVWLRAASIGGGGKGALPTADIDFARAWLNHHKGWGDFLAAELLTSETVTWLSIWFEGELVVAQTRIRQGWIHGNRTVSGVTGVTKVGKTFSDAAVDEIAMRAVHAVSKKPHGIYGVDMAYDAAGVPNPTEINISRFFTTVLFFTEAGLNMPEIFKNLALYGERPQLARKLNPLPDGLLWMRGMDALPRLATEADLRREINFP